MLAKLSCFLLWMSTLRRSWTQVKTALCGVLLIRLSRKFPTFAQIRPNGLNAGPLPKLQHGAFCKGGIENFNKAWRQCRYLIRGFRIASTPPPTSGMNIWSICSCEERYWMIVSVGTLQIDENRYLTVKIRVWKNCAR